jgi:hypothetical protein
MLAVVEHAIKAVLAIWDEISAPFNECDPFVLGCLRRWCHAVSGGGFPGGAMADSVNQDECT